MTATNITPKTQKVQKDGVVYKIQRKSGEGFSYVGSTGDFNRRKADHKHIFHNEKHRTYGKNPYVYIRDNGGWNDFEFVILEIVPYAPSLSRLHNKYALGRRENFYVVDLKPQLNCQVPMRSIDFNNKCEHGTDFSKCKLGCGGGAFCEHGTQRSHCRLGCGGGAFCLHEIMKIRCAICEPVKHATRLEKQKIYDRIKAAEKRAAAGVEQTLSSSDEGSLASTLICDCEK
jgi:hypothetical protein